MKYITVKWSFAVQIANHYDILVNVRTEKEICMRYPLIKWQSKWLNYKLMQIHGNIEDCL